MSLLLQCRHVSQRVGTKTLFRDISLAINAGEKTGLVGHNGSGKSTLLGLLAGTLEADEGEITRGRDLRLESVEQFIPEGLLEFSLKEALIDKLPPADRDWEIYRVDMMLAELGFAEREHQIRVKDLSGGQQNRLMLARATLNEPSLVLLDEPTNHLDLKTLLIFEKALASMPSAFVMISHDRAFLDKVTNKTVFLRDERLYEFDLPYSQARLALEEQDANAESRRELEDREIDRVAASAKRLALMGRNHNNEKFARRAKSMEKRVERMKEDRTFVTRGSGLHLSLDKNSGAAANRMLHIEKCDVRVHGLADDDRMQDQAGDAKAHGQTDDVQAPGQAGDGFLFHIEDLMIKPGERVALLGRNGVGKTTLIKLIMAKHAEGKDGGEIRFNPKCEIGYYDQELELLDPKRDLMQSLRAQTSSNEEELKKALIKAGFPYDQFGKKVGVLSGGEKARLMFLIIRLNSPNFLILDEPTNHIDLDGREELEDEILSSAATVLITSHDRQFTDNIAQRYLLISNGRLQEINSPNKFYQSVAE